MAYIIKTLAIIDYFHLYKGVLCVRKIYSIQMARKVLWQINCHTGIDHLQEGSN